MQEKQKHQTGQTKQTPRTTTKEQQQNKPTQRFFTPQPSPRASAPHLALPVSAPLRSRIPGLRTLALPDPTDPPPDPPIPAPTPRSANNCTVAAGCLGLMVANGYFGGKSSGGTNKMK